MPRTSPYEIILSKEERDTFKRIARKYTSPYFEVIRAKAILLAACGFSAIPKTYGASIDDNNIHLSLLSPSDLPL